MGFFSKLFGGGGGKKGLKVVDATKRWDLRGRTGQGSMSKVYQAYDRDIGRTICLKLLDKVKTQKFEERFKVQGLTKPSEGEVCVGLSHINCVKTFEHGITTKGDPYLVMEWIEGRGLNFLIETRNAQLVGKRVNYMMQLCDAVDYLHTTGYLHRDLCPRNVMVDSEGVVKLIDFGLTIPYTPPFCAPGNRTGTADYLAPEIIKRMATDNRVDLFALGVTAFELFTGQMPWERTANSDENLRRRLNSAPRRAKDLAPHLDDELVAILAKSIERDKNLRFRNAKEMKEAFAQLARQDY